MIISLVLNLLLWGSTAVSKSFEFVQLLEKYKFAEQDRLLSFDVQSLFTRVPIPESLKIIGKHLQELSELTCNPVKQITSMSNKAILKLLEHSLGQKSGL